MLERVKSDGHGLLSPCFAVLSGNTLEIMMKMGGYLAAMRIKSFLCRGGPIPSKGSQICSA